MKKEKGRFRDPIDPDELRFSYSLPVDRRLYRQDIEGSLAHLEMLRRRKIIPARDATRIRKALIEILHEIETGRYSLTPDATGGLRFAAEDVHMAIEHRLIEKIGERGGMLHTARSRNDQVALDEHLYLRDVTRAMMAGVRNLQRVFLAKAREYENLIMPGYTHLQRAQPVLLAHHLLAYVSMLDRDHGRLEDCLRRLRRSPLGAGALAGTSFPIDPKLTAHLLGFVDASENSMDAVADRDLIIEFLGACSIIMMHLSRFAEELVSWSSQEWGFAEIGDAFTTGSSIMPQKKNPDMAELIRGKTGRVYGDLVTLLTVMKGLPLAYNRDMQEDKEPLFDAADTVESSLRVAGAMLVTTRFNRDRFEQELGSDFLLATELADYLVRKGMPFRQAHAIVGSIVQECIAENRLLKEFPLVRYREYSRLFAKDIAPLFDARESVARKQSFGSTSPKEVRKALNRWEKRLRVLPQKSRQEAGRLS